MRAPLPSLSGAAEQLVPLVSRRQAESLGFDLGLDDLVLAILRARILYGAITWDELRAEFARKLAPRA